MGEPLLPIVAEVSIAAPVEHVWSVLVGEATVPQWLGAMDYRPEVGATFFMQQDPERKARGDTEGSTWCEITRMQKPHKFNFSWYVPGTPETLVQISLFTDGPRQTFVRLIHDGWDDFEREAIEGFYNDIAAGWKMAVLPNLKRLAETTA
ncbi:MAG TPA: SRPBCC domain-containing protein [Devosia sp.]|nr:SRPBCC domain-containing protein [Devosia sp.]